MIVLIGLALIVSLVANWLLGRALLQSFSKLQASRIFPLGYVAVQNSAPLQPQYHAIVFWGDSRAQTWATAPGVPLLPAVNLAHGGQTSSQLLLQIKQSHAFNSEFALVQIGINDLHPLGILRPYKPDIVKQLRENVPAIVRALSPAASTIILTTIIPPGRPPLERRLAWDGETIALISEINELIRRQADGQRVVLLDASALLAGTDGFLSDQYLDGDFFLHINGAAYARLNSELRRIVALRRVGDR
jgi:hypothetical protein